MNPLLIYPDMEKDFGVMVDGSTLNTADNLFQEEREEKEVIELTGK